MTPDQIVGLPAKLKPDITRAALISPCKLYRYSLRRQWVEKPKLLVFILHNPSTADAEKDDPTIRKCMGFAYHLGYTGIEVVNLFAGRATKPADLYRMADPVGPMNDAYLQRLVQAVGGQAVIAGWGAHVKAQARAAEIVPRLGKIRCLGTNQDGSPKHPLYVPYSMRPVRWV